MCGEGKLLEVASECPLSPQALVPSADLLTMTISSATGTHSFRLHTSNSVFTATSSVQTLVPCVVRRPTNVTIQYMSFRGQCSWEAGGTWRSIASRGSVVPWRRVDQGLQTWRPGTTTREAKSPLFHGQVMAVEMRKKYARVGGPPVNN